jgi:multiple sugar transport system ATP-binding protein
VWLRVGAGSEEWRLGLPSAPTSWAGRELVVGIRPEDLRPGRGELQARLELAERLGGECVLHLRRGGVSLRARAPADFPARADELVPLEAEAARFHYFAEGRRVEPSD